MWCRYSSLVSNRVVERNEMSSGNSTSSLRMAVELAADTSDKFLSTTREEFLLRHYDSNYQLNGTVPEVRETEKRKNKKATAKETTSSKKLNSTFKESNDSPVQQKPDSKIRHINDEWKDNPCIDDAPPCGPAIYFILVGFHDIDILKGLAAEGIPLLCFIKLYSAIRSGGSEKQSKIDYSKKQTVLRKPENKGQKKQKNKIQNVDELSLEEQELAINTFWEAVECGKEDKSRIFGFDDLPVVPFELPDLPLDEQMYSELGQALYRRLSFLVYDIYCLKMKYLSFIQKMKIWLKNSGDYVTDSEEMNIYNALMDKIPAESITVPLILECMLEGVENGGEKISTNSTSFYQAQGNKDPIELVKNILPEVDQKYCIIHKSKKRAKLDFPRIIHFGDELLMKMYPYLDSASDSACVPYHLLQHNPISILWNKYPSPSYCEEIFYAYHMKIFSEAFQNENFDYNIVFYLFCLLNFEEMLRTIHKINFQIREESSFLISRMMPQYVIVSNNQSIFITLEQMKNLVFLSEAVGYKIINLDDVKSEDTLAEDYLKQFHLKKKNVKIALSDKDCDRIFKFMKAKTEMSVEKKISERTGKRNSSNELNSNVSSCIEEINFSSEFSFEHLSESHSFHCKEIEDLFSNKDSSNLFKYTKFYGFVEQLNEQVFAQVIHSCLMKFSEFKHHYFKPCDLLLVLFYNPHDIERIHKYKWSAKLPSPVSFRNFYDSVLYEETDCLVEENEVSEEMNISSDKVTAPSNVVVHKDDSNTFVSVNKDEFLLEDSIKYNENFELLKNMDESDTKSVKEKSSKSKKPNKEMQNENARKPSSEIEVSASHTGKITKESSIGMVTKERKSSGEKTSISDEDGKESVLEHAESQVLKYKVNVPKSFSFEGYDLGSEKVEFFGEDTKFISSNGKMLISVKSLLQHGKQRIISIEIEQDKNSMFYHIEPTDESGNVSCNNDKHKILTFHLVLKNGVIIVFANTVSNPGNSSDMEKLKEAKESKNKEDEIETVKVEGEIEKNKISKHTINKSSERVGKKYPTNGSHEGLEWKVVEDDLKCAHVCGFDMNLSLPSGLCIERKASHGSPFYIKQKYISKGKNSVTDEEFRLCLFNGNILKFMTNGEIIILCPNSTVYICKTFELFEKSDENENTENLKDKMRDSNNISTKNYTTLLPSGKCYEKINGNFHELPSLFLRYATDLEVEKVCITRGDGTCSVLQCGGHLIVNFPDKSCISTTLNLIEEDFLSDLVWEEGDLAIYFSNSDISESNSNSEENGLSIIIGKPVVEEAYVVIYLNYQMEHPNFASIYFDGLIESATISLPQKTAINIMKDGKYHLKVHNSIDLDVMDSHAKYINGNAESTLYFQNETEDKNLLCRNNDGLGNIFTIKLDGTTNISRVVGRDSVEEEKRSKMRLLAVKRDNSGAEFHERRDIESYLAEAKLDAKVSVSKHLECDTTEQQSPFFTIFSPLTEFEKNNWLMPVENSVDAIRHASSNVVRSTYWVDDKEKPASFWFNPFPKSKNRNEGTESQSSQCWDESMGDVLCLRILRQLSSLGIPHGRLSLAKIMLQAFQSYKKGIYRIHEIGGSKIQDKYLIEDDPENLKMENKILKEKMWLDNSKTFVWNADIEKSFITGLFNKTNEVTPVTVQHNLVRNEEKRLKKLQSLREAAKKEQEDWIKLRKNVILPYHTLYSEQ